MDEDADRKTRTATAWLLGLMAGVAILGLLGIAYLIGFNHGKGEATTASTTGVPPAASQATTAPRTTASAAGEKLFASACGSCHTLSAAGTTGTTGPNLDQLRPDQAQVEAAIANGGTGSGVMPKGLYSGKQAREVAQYVSTVAGQ